MQPSLLHVFSTAQGTGVLKVEASLELALYQEGKTVYSLLLVRLSAAENSRILKSIKLCLKEFFPNRIKKVSVLGVKLWKKQTAAGRFIPCIY